jgi:hypothetical protein
MKELKTLKDLNIIKGKVHALGGEVGIDELRKEAIKWVKSIEQEQRDLENYQKNNNKKDYYNFNPRKQGMISFIKKFFNLTKEDLEEKE